MEVSSDYRSEFLVVLGCAYIPGLIMVFAISLGVSSVHYLTLFGVGVVIAFSISIACLWKAVMKKWQHQTGVVTSLSAANSKLCGALMSRGPVQESLSILLKKNLRAPLWKFSLVVALGCLLAGSIWR